MIKLTATTMAALHHDNACECSSCRSAVFLAMTFTASKTFKTRAGAQRWYDRMTSA